MRAVARFQAGDRLQGSGIGQFLQATLLEVETATVDDQHQAGQGYQQRNPSNDAEGTALLAGRVVAVVSAAHDGKSLSGGD
ncbi:hypothetical protein D3C81_1300240 [compost metagenome]